VPSGGETGCGLDDGRARRFNGLCASSQRSDAMRVLLIEVDPMIGKSLKQALQNESMRVDWTRSGVEGEEALSTDDYAAVLLDLNLPDRNHRPPPRLVAHAAQPCRRRDPRDSVGAGRDERHEGSVQFGTP